MHKVRTGLNRLDSYCGLISMRNEKHQDGQSRQHVSRVPLLRGEGGSSPLIRTRSRIVSATVSRISDRLPPVLSVDVDGQDDERQVLASNALGKVIQRHQDGAAQFDVTHYLCEFRPDRRRHLVADKINRLQQPVAGTHGPGQLHQHVTELAVERVQAAALAKAQKDEGYQGTHQSHT